MDLSFLDDPEFLPCGMKGIKRGTRSIQSEERERERANALAEILARVPPEQRDFFRQKRMYKKEDATTVPAGHDDELLAIERAGFEWIQKTSGTQEWNTKYEWEERLERMSEHELTQEYDRAMLDFERGRKALHAYGDKGIILCNEIIFAPIFRKKCIERVRRARKALPPPRKFTKPEYTRRVFTKPTYAKH